MERERYVLVITRALGIYVATNPQQLCYNYYISHLIDHRCMHSMYIMYMAHYILYILYTKTYILTSKPTYGVLFLSLLDI